MKIINFFYKFLFFNFCARKFREKKTACVGCQKTPVLGVKKALKKPNFATFSQVYYRSPSF
jgi:hypothetical protein